MLAAKHPLVVPMLLRLSHFKLDSYVVLVVSRQKGITLVFKTDPLQHVDINSTFDSIAVIQEFIQREIEGQLRQMFREDLPGIIHRLSQQWVKAKVEAPYLNKRPPPPTRSKMGTASSEHGLPMHRTSMGAPHLGLRPTIPQRAASTSGSLIGRPRPRSTLTSFSAAARSVSLRTDPSISVTQTDSSSLPHDDVPSSFPDIEHFDPTYGLRPEGLPAKSMFKNFRSLFSPNKGLAELTEESSEAEDEENETSFSVAPWEDFMTDAGFSVPSPSEIDDVEEYETVPAVGGGVITRPRILHAHSQILSPAGDIPPSPAPSSSRLQTRSRLSVASVSSLGDMRSSHSTVPRYPPMLSIPSPSHPWTGPYNPYFAGMTPVYEPSIADSGYEPDDYYPHRGQIDPRIDLSSSPPSATPVPPLEQSYEQSFHRVGSPSSLRTRNSRSTAPTHSIPTPPNPESEDGDIRVSRTRRSSFSSSPNMEWFGSPLDGYHLSGSEHDPKIVLKPGLNSASRLSTLSHSNFTLSPYTQTLEHFTVRSVPPRETTSSGSGSAGERQPVKARRKRTFYLGRKSAKEVPKEIVAELPERVYSPVPASSDFDASDMDRYFRSGDDQFPPKYPTFPPSYVRQRSRYHQ